MGTAAVHCGIIGGLLVAIGESPHPDLKREGADLIYNLPLNVADAILGASVEIPTVDGKARIKIEPGTVAGRVLRLRGKGIPDVNGYGTGDLLVVVDIHIPAHVSPAEKRRWKNSALRTISNRPHRPKRVICSNGCGTISCLDTQPAPTVKSGGMPKGQGALRKLLKTPCPLGGVYLEVSI